jgi:hypothetical protein
MAADEKHPHGGANAEPAPFFNEEAEEEARPVVPLVQTRDEATVVRPRRGRLPRNVVLALAVVIAGAAGVAAGYLAHTRQTTESAAEVTTSETPERAPTPSAANDGPETSASVPAVRRAQDKPQARVELERPDSKENEGRGRDEEAEEARAESIKKEGEGHSEKGKRSAERPREDEKKIAERRRDEEKGEKPKARLVGTITGGGRPD